MTTGHTQTKIIKNGRGHTHEWCYVLYGLLNGIGGFEKNIYISNLFFNTQMVLRKLTKEEAKEEVKKLVDKYNRILESGSIKRYKEEDTKAEFIEPLFEALGWDVRNTENDDEVVREEKISKGRVDYSFRVNGIPKFFLEAKALKEDLDNIKFVEQAINYAWHKGCTWAVLTDFEAIKIFNAEWKSANPVQAQFGQTLPCQLFLEKFDTLWLLSRESFEKKLLDIEAEKWGKKIKKTAVDKQLLDDLTRFRDLLNKNILKNNSSKNLSGDELDEAVQRIIDRLIFIRTLEDKELEAPMLQSVIREDLNKRIYKKLNLIFRKIDDIYNSKLFTRHLCENLEIDDEVLSKIINGLFNTSDNTVHYDFSAIDADVLGNIYEQYLGHILKKTDKRAKLAEGKAHRKEQGIYYTPTYVVDYIVKNTVGELAKDKKFDLKNIKILDPACGSGSFLMKAFDYLVTLDKKKNGEIDQTKLDLTGASATYGRKVEILKNNIFGVDLDPKAVEIAQLNLLLKAAEKKHRLPTLQENIKVGNSLIDDSAIVGDRAFKWEEQFKDIIQYDEKGNLKEGYGFDVVIGNPPYVFAREKINDNEKEYYNKNYETIKYQVNTYVLFIERAFKLLKSDGRLGFIVPDAWLRVESVGNLRKYLLVNCWLEKIIHIRGETFEGVGVESSIFILKKSKKTATTKVSTDLLKLNYVETSQRDWLNNPNCEIDLFSDKNTKKILEKLHSGTKPLDEVSDIKAGLQAYEKGKGNPVQSASDVKNRPYDYDQKYDENTYKYLEGKDIKRYGCDWNGQWLRYGKWLAAPRTFNLFNSPRILIREIPAKPPYCLVVSYLENIYLNNRSIINILKKTDGIELKYILAVLNSKIISFYHTNKSVKAQRDLFPKVTLNDLRNIPIKVIPRKEQMSFVSFADKELSLNKRLYEIKDKQTDQKAQLEKEIQKLDSEIDEEVYKLYEITEEEKKIIEESLK